MSMQDKDGHYPMLGIQEFRKGQLAGRDELLFNELHGERHIDKPHKHDFFIIMLFDRGKGLHHIDFTAHPVGDRQVHLLFPGQVHRWNIESVTTGYQLMIGRSLFERFSPYFRFATTNYQHHPVVPLSDAAFTLLHYEFDAIKKELETGDSLYELLDARTAVIAALVSKEAEKVFPDFKVYQSEPRLVRFLQLIDLSFREEKLVSFYARQLHISANYLNILCRKKLNVPATQLIQQRVILEAKRLLQATGQSVKEIAFELGFVDHAYFSNFFKAQTGVTPTAFRLQ